MLKVTIGIPAYNEEDNIRFILDSSLNQKETDSFKISEVIVVSDGSVDATPDIVNEYCKVNSKVKLFHHNSRRGKGYALNVIFSKGSGDIFVLFDADVIPKDEWVVRGLVEPFISDGSVGLVGGLPVPLPPESIVEMAGVFSYRLQRFIKESIRGGCNLYAAHGRVLALSSSLAKVITVPSMPAVDAFLYLKCISMGYKFVYVGERAVVFYRAPRDVKGYVSQSARFKRAREPLRKIFGSVVDEEVKVSRRILLEAYVKSLMEDPRGGLLWTLLYSYATLTASRMDVSGRWLIVEKSKALYTKERARSKP